jgi:hypothetical protein
VKLEAVVVGSVTEYPIVVAVVVGEQVVVGTVGLSMRSSRVLTANGFGIIRIDIILSSNLSSRQENVSATEPIKLLFFFAPHSEDDEGSLRLHVRPLVPL